MRLLILTQKVDINDDVLGFFHDWIFEFARNCEKVTVICLYKGEYDLPSNVKVLSLGKEFDDSKFKIGNSKLFIKLKFIFLFYKYIWQERNNYDSVFVHMNQIYVLLGGLFWRFRKNKIALWFAHKSVNFSLRLSEKLVDVIFSASCKSFRLASKKLVVSGHGIDINKFLVKNKLRIDNKFKILTVGRISAVKNYETLIKAISLICEDKSFIKNFQLEVNIVGGPLLREDEQYFDDLKNLVLEKKLEDIIIFIGSVPNKNIAKYYQESDLFVHSSNTGSLDKVLLEAMASGVLVLSSNDSGKAILQEFGDKLIFDFHDAGQLAERIKGVVDLNIENKVQISKKLVKIVQDEHSLNKLIKKIIFKMLD